MKYSYSLFLSLLMVGFCFAQPEFDILITGGRIIDGTGNPAYFADIGINDGKIIKIGRINSGNAREWINATGLIISPGFIDVHTHVDSGIFRQPEAANFVQDGVTTVVTGNCGGSPRSIGNYFLEIDTTKSAINIASLIGHGTIRRQIMESVNREPTPEELGKMKELVKQAMEDGAVGLSSGLIYIPGTFSKTTELVELCKVVSQYNGIYATHMRNEGNQVLNAISEACYIGWMSGVPVQISHLKIGVPNNVGPGSLLLDEIKLWRSYGLDVTADQYPYPASSTGLSVLLPDWVLDGGMDEARKKLNDPELRIKIRDEMIQGFKKRGRKDLSYAVIASYSDDRSLQGMNLKEVAKLKRGKTDWVSQVETVLDLLKEGSAGMVYHGMDEKDVQTIMQGEFVSICSDAGIRTFGSGVPHPRGYGSNSRVLGRYVRELGVLSLEDAIRKMTSLPAQTFQLKDRGMIQEDKWADITIFNPDTVIDKATFTEPHQYPVGIEYVLVNGKIVVSEEKHTGQLPGKPLYGPGKKSL